MMKSLDSSWTLGAAFVILATFLGNLIGKFTQSAAIYHWLMKLLPRNIKILRYYH